MNLTDTQRNIHAFIAERIEADGFAPSQAEIARAFGFKGVRAAQYHLEALEAAGIVERSPGRARKSTKPGIAMQSVALMVCSGAKPAGAAPTPTILPSAMAKSPVLCVPLAGSSRLAF